MGMVSDVNFAEMANIEVMTAEVKSEVMLGAMENTDEKQEDK